MGLCHSKNNNNYYTQEEKVGYNQIPSEKTDKTVSEDIKNSNVNFKYTTKKEQSNDFETKLNSYLRKNNQVIKDTEEDIYSIKHFHNEFDFEDRDNYFTEDQEKQIKQSILDFGSVPQWAKAQFKKVQPNNLEIMGQGSFGFVYKAYDENNKIDIAIKRIFLGSLTNMEKQKLNNEIECLQVMSNQNIVKFYGYDLKQDMIDIYQEYVDLGSLRKFLNAHKKFPEPLVAYFCSQILQGLAYIHQKRLLHRDIKPGNLVFNKQGILKIIDFGLTKKLAENNMSMAGTLVYIAPEVYKNQHYDRQADIWSFGVTVLEMITGNLLYKDYKELNKNLKNQDENYDFLKSIELSELAKDFIFCCLRKNHKKRFNALELQQHPFLNLQNKLQHSELWTSVCNFSSFITPKKKQKIA